jgi:hypothetical protein
MVNSHETFGRVVGRSQSVAQFLKLERDHKLDGSFAELDLLVGRLLAQGLRGARIVELKRDELYIDRVCILRLSKDERDLIDNWFAVEKQQARGTWTLPEKVSMRVGFASLRWAYSQLGRFGTGLAMDERVSVKLATNPDAVLYWSLLDGLFSKMCIPFELRGPQEGALPREKQLAGWAEADALYQALGFDVQDQLAVMRYGGGWNRLCSPDQLEAKVRLLNALGQQANVHMGQRYRAYRILPFIWNYYKKANNDGRVARKRALTRDLERTLSAYWGGDWLSYLAYLGEQPHPDEQITTALPKIKPMVTRLERIDAIAANQGLGPDVVRSIATSYWQETGGVSPVEQRVQCLRRYWQIFDCLHRRQNDRTQSLWGLATDTRYVILSSGDGPTFHRDLHLELLPEDLLLDINNLWSTTMDAKWPDRILTEPFPYHAMVETLGPALKFFEGCSLTAWFLCERGSGRTDMKGLAHYYRREIDALERLGTPVDRQFFSDLIEAEAKLGLFERIEEDASRTDQDNLSPTDGTSVCFKRSGTEELRQTVTSYRHIWTEKYLDAYLKACWESEITHAGRAYNIMVQDGEGRTPRLREFAKVAGPPTNHWFGGNVCGLYSAIREKCPAEPKRVQLMPADVVGFTKRLYETLPSQPNTLPDREYPNSYRVAEYIEHIANLGIKYIQMEEGLGRPPEMKELGQKFLYYSKAIPGDLNEAWETFVKTVKEAREFV